MDGALRTRWLEMGNSLWGKCSLPRFPTGPALVAWSHCLCSQRATPSRAVKPLLLLPGGLVESPPPLGRLCGKFSGLMGFSAGVRFPSSSAWGPLAVSADISGCRISGGGKGLCAHP